MIQAAVLFVLFVQCTFINYSYQLIIVPPSPCPNVFEYRFDGNQYFGFIRVNSPQHQLRRNILLQVTLSIGRPVDVSFFLTHILCCVLTGKFQICAILIVSILGK